MNKRSNKRWAVLSCLAISSAISATVTAAPVNYDIVVYGGTSGGVAAAVQAARMGMRVAIVEPTSHLGGMSSNGLSFTDTGNTSAIGGFASDFYRRVGRSYSETGNEYDFEPHVAENTFDALASEAGVTVYYDQSLPDSGGIAKSGTKVTSITTTGGLQLSGKVFVDASYTGDLMAGSGISSTVGREANSQYGETYNGVQTAQAVKNQITANISPYVIAGDPSSGLLPGISTTLPGANGSADNGVQAYTYRLTLTKTAANKQAWTKPAGYDASQYTLMSRFIAASNITSLTSILKLSSIQGGKYDLNNQTGVSTDFIGGSIGYPTGTAAQRATIAAATQTYELGLLYFLATDPSVPQTLRTQMNAYGLTKDEFTDNGGVSGQLYVREGRRMIGETVMTDNQVLGKSSVTDSIALGSYTMDSHNVQRYVNASGFVKNEGDVQVSVATPYGISLQSLLPQASQASNVIVPVAMSASHIAYGSIRMEPVFMEMGQAAGVVAADAVNANSSVQSVNYSTVQSQLQLNGAITKWGTTTAPRFVGTVSENFDYGVDDSRVDVSSYTTGGWSQAWGPGFNTSTNANQLSSAAAYEKAANLTYTGAGYKNSTTVGTLISGGASSGSSTTAGVVTSRGITGGMTGTIWISGLVEIDTLAGTNQDALIWLDRTAAGNSDNTGNAFIGLRSGGIIALRTGGTNNFFESDGDTYAPGVAHLLLAKIDIDYSSTMDSIQFWIDPNLQNLGTANLSTSGTNIFGTSFDGLGISVGSGGGEIDNLRVSNAADGFNQVTGVPEPTSFSLVVVGAACLARRRRRVMLPFCIVDSGIRKN